MKTLPLQKSREDGEETRRKRETRRFFMNKQTNVTLLTSRMSVCDAFYSHTWAVGKQYSRSLFGFCCRGERALSLSYTEDEREDTRTRRDYIRTQRHQISRDLRNSASAPQTRPLPSRKPSARKPPFNKNILIVCGTKLITFFLSIRPVYVINVILH